MKASQFLIAGAVAALLPFAAAVAQSPPSQSPSSDPATQQSQPAQKGATFESLDADGDGRISKTEAAANQNVLDQFSRYDKDGNGFIERAEVTSANKSSASGEPQQ